MNGKNVPAFYDLQMFITLTPCRKYGFSPPHHLTMFHDSLLTLVAKLREEIFNFNFNFFDSLIFCFVFEILICVAINTDCITIAVHLLCVGF